MNFKQIQQNIIMMSFLLFTTIEELTVDVQLTEELAPLSPPGSIMGDISHMF